MRKIFLLLGGFLISILIVAWLCLSTSNASATAASVRVGLPEFWVIDDQEASTPARLQGYSLNGRFLFQGGGKTHIQIGDTLGFRIEFLDANLESKPTGADPFSGKGYLFTGHNPAAWQKNLALYREVQYPDLYPGVDLHWSWGAEGLKSTYQVAPGANPDQIRWAYQGVEEIHITPEGALSFSLPCLNPEKCTLYELPPIVWQMIDGEYEEVRIAYQIDGSYVKFDIEGYERGLPLYIDPSINSQIEMNGPGQVQLKRVEVDKSGNLYIAGDVRGGALDLAPSDVEIGMGGLVRYNRDTQTWESIPSNLNISQATTLVADPQNATILYAGTVEEGAYKSIDGGQTWNAINNGFEKAGFEGREENYSRVHNIFVNPEDSDELFLILQTKGLYKSTDQGATWTLLSDSFQLNNIEKLIISKENANILLVSGSSQLLRSEDGGQTWANEPDSAQTRCMTQLEDGTVLVCSADSIFKTTDFGATWERIYRSSSLIASQLVAHPDDPLTLSFIGTQPLRGFIQQIFITRDGGRTWTAGENLPIRAGYQNNFDPRSASDIWLTYELGADLVTENGTLLESINSGLPSLKLCCQTVSSEGNLIAIAQNDWDSFVLKLTPDGQDILYAAYFGGDSDEALKGLAIHSDGSVFAGGRTLSPDFPVLNPYEETIRHGQSAYLVRLSPVGDLQYATYYASQIPGMMETEALAVDSQGRAVLMGTNVFFDIDTSSRLFVVRFTPEGDALTIERHIGGDDNIRGVWNRGLAITLDSDDNIYLAGYSNSRFFPLIRPLQDQFKEDRTSTVFGGDGVIVRLENDSGEIIWSTYFGGNGADEIVDIAINAEGNLVIAGTTSSGDLPSRELGVQPRQSGGLYSFADGTWSSKNAGLPLLAIQTIAVNPKNPANLVITIPRYGVYYSRDGGETWAPSTLIEEAPQGVLLYASEDWMMAADSRTVYISRDGGQTWEPTEFKNPNIGTPDSIYFIPQDPLILYAGVRGLGIVRSVDGGETWQETNFNTSTPSKITQIEAARDDPQIMTASDGTRGYRSVDGGLTWDLITEPDQMRWITFDPHVPGSIYALDSFDIYRSLDYGETWENIADKGFSDTMLLIDPVTPGTFYLFESSGTLQQSEDNGATWTHLVDFENLSSFVLSPDPNTLGYGAVRISTDGFVSLIDVEANLINWTTYLGGSFNEEVTSLAIDRQGDIYIAGTTQGTIPLIEPWEGEIGGTQDAFLIKLTGTGDQTQYSTLLGNVENDSIADIRSLQQGELIAVGSQWIEAKEGFTIAGIAHLVLDATPTPQPTKTQIPSPMATATEPVPTATENPGTEPTSAAETGGDTLQGDQEDETASPSGCLGGILPLVLAGAFIFQISVRSRRRRDFIGRS